jgi:hypothetical protein
MAQTEENPIKVPEPVYVLRRVRAPERYLPDGTYNSKPLSPTYSRDYYHRTKADTKCEYCEKVVCHPQRLKEHMRKSKKCFLIRENIKLKQALEAKQIVEFAFNLLQ